MNCNKCGLNNNEGNTRCSNCGNVLIDDSQINNNNLKQPINNKKIMFIIFAMLLVIFTMVTGYYIYNSTHDNNILASEEQDVNNDVQNKDKHQNNQQGIDNNIENKDKQENNKQDIDNNTQNRDEQSNISVNQNNIEEYKNTIALKLVDPSTEEFSGCPASKDINDSKYLKIKEDNVSPMFSTTDVNAKQMARANLDEYTNTEKKFYTADVTLENYKAALSECSNCFEGYCDANKVCHNWSYEAWYYIKDSKIGKNKITLHVTSDAWLYGIYVNEEYIGYSNLYTFNDEYVVAVKFSANTTGPSLNDGIYIYDQDGNNVFKLKDISLDTIENKITYTKPCEGATYYEACENVIYGEIRYNPKTKEFVNITEEKSIDEYCSENYCS